MTCKKNVAHTQHLHILAKNVVCQKNVHHHHRLNNGSNILPDKWNIIIQNALHRYCHKIHHGLWLRSQQVNQIRTNIKLSLYPTFCSKSLSLSHFLLIIIIFSPLPPSLIFNIIIPYSVHYLQQFPHSAGRCRVPPHKQFRPLGLSQLRKSTRIPWELENENKELKVEHVKVDARVKVNSASLIIC